MKRKRTQSRAKGLNILAAMVGQSFDIGGDGNVGRRREALGNLVSSLVPWDPSMGLNPKKPDRT